jgi:hypothetical protein
LAAARHAGLDEHAAIVVVFQRTWPARVIEMRSPPGYQAEAANDVVIGPPAPPTVVVPRRQEPALPPLSLLPSEDIDPGWELGAAPPSDVDIDAVLPKTPFERALAAAATRPHVPHAPAAHPQMRALMRGTGGLTLGPPGDDSDGGIDLAPPFSDDT